MKFFRLMQCKICGGWFYRRNHNPHPSPVCDNCKMSIRVRLANGGKSRQRKYD